MPDSDSSSTPSEALTTIDVQEEEQDAQTFKALCASRLRLLQQQYKLMKDCLNKSMVVSDIWWAAHKVNNTERKRTLGTQLIDEVILPYLHNIDALVKAHENRFKADEMICMYFEFCEEALARCFTPADGLTVEQAYAEKGLAVCLAEVDEIKHILRVFRQHFGRKILLEKAAQGFGIRHLLSESAKRAESASMSASSSSSAPAPATASSSWSWLWSASTKDEDRVLWVMFPHTELENVQRKAFNVIKMERANILESKIDYVEDYWHAKQQLDEDEPLLDDDEDKEWESEFVNCTSRRFNLFVEDVKLRLMKDCSLSNFRFLAPLTAKIGFDEHIHAKRLGRCNKDDLYEYVQYRLDCLEAEKAHVESMEFYFEGPDGYV
ncbi:hypothetical protein UA08_00367 [Talaromyces atroroseus]|uniref:Uncharacterized protein n=1 Tax=Talaromyces atroroseus TaxID=1441469 RepID=A0A225ASL4_TALAT|nr:hypothetical protein UA08_00367 [Talaromyces atroroseus]OKL64591.1 hypothetical protein UA08_00367 [Talaromyces atroroseus]